LDSWRPEQMVEALDHGFGTVFCQRSQHARVGGKGLTAPLVFRTLRDLAGDDGRAQRPLDAVVGRLNPRIRQEAKQVAPVVMPAEFIEQPLIVWIFQATVAQMVGDRCPQDLGFGLELRYGAVTPA
jgi:hypothetical protein